MIIELYGDWWEGVSDLGAPVPNPSWEDCARAIEALDQERRTSVAITSDVAGMLALAGGRGRIFVELTTPDEQFLSPLVSDAVGGMERLVTGGQPGDFDRRFIADPETALRLAERFFFHEEPSPDFEWVSNQPNVADR